MSYNFSHLVPIRYADLWDPMSQLLGTQIRQLYSLVDGLFFAGEDGGWTFEDRSVSFLSKMVLHNNYIDYILT